MSKTISFASLVRRRAGVLAVLVTLAAPLLLAGPASEPRAAEPFALSLLPASADLVVWLDYATLRKSELVAEMESRIDSLPDAAEHYRQFVRETGLDPRQDTDSILMSLREADGTGGDGFLLVAQGRFAGSRIVEAAAAKGGLLTTNPRGIKIWISGDRAPDESGPGADKSVMALAQPGDGTLLFGSEPEVQRAVNVAIRAKSPAGREPRLRDLLAGVDRKAPVWAVLDSQNVARQISSGIPKDSGGGPNAGAALASVVSARMSAYVGRDVDLKVQVDAKDKESAGLLGDLFRGMVAAGKLSAKDNDPELLKILQEMSLVETGTGIEMKVRIPASRLRPPQGGDPGK